MSPPGRFSGAAAVLLVASLASATIVVHADADRLATLADVVVDGTVKTRAVVLEAEPGTIWTTYQLDVLETWLGTERATLTVHVPGGRVGDLEQEVAGTARLDVGDRAVLFLTQEEQRLLVLGEAQGCFRVERSGDGRGLVCRSDLDGLALVDAAGAPVEAEPIEMPHAELRRRVREVAEQRAEAERRRRDEQQRKLEELRERALRNAERTRGKPGGAR